MKAAERKSEFEQLLDELEAALNEGKRVPLTDLVMVNEAAILDLFDHLRRALPDELQKAAWIIKDREKILADARAIAEKTVLEAQGRAGQLVSQDEVTHQAQARAGEIVAEAQRKAAEMKDGAEAYAGDVLMRFEGELLKVLEVIRHGKERLNLKVRHGAPRGKTS
ncbi:MAG: ATPase [Bacillota bacterium]